MEHLIIKDLNKLKFTSIKFNGNVIHFKYDNQDFFLRTNWGFGETTTTQLYKGRCKSKNNICIKSTYGFIHNLLIYKYNRNNLSSIDKFNFVKQLYSSNLIKSAPFEVERQCKIDSEIYKISDELFKIARRL